jgi:hypothetical protein
MKPQIVIHIEGGLVQGVISDQPLDYIVADTDVEGACMQDTLPVPPPILRHIVSGRMARLVWQEASVDNPIKLSSICARRLEKPSDSVQLKCSEGLRCLNGTADSEIHAQADDEAKVIR